MTDSDTTMVCDQVPLDSLGDPWLVALAAEARLPGGSALDTTAWQFVLIEPVTAPLLEPEAIAVGGEPTPLPEAESGGS